MACANQYGPISTTNLYDKTVTQLTGSLSECFIGAYSEPKIEAEIVFHFRDTPSVGATSSELLECTDWIAHRRTANGKTAWA